MPRLKHLLVVALAVLAAAAPAVEPAERKAAAKALWSEAQKRGALWTCLQIESWGQGQTPVFQPGSPVLGNTRVFGSPLFAAPRNIDRIVDTGDQIGVFAGSEFLVFSSDGLPAQVPYSFGFGTWGGAWSGDRRVAAGSEVLDHLVAKPARFHIKVVGSGPNWEVEERGLPREELGRLIISHDGSAVAASSTRSKVFTAKGMTVHRGVHEISAIANGGSLFIGRTDKGWMLVGPDQRLPIVAGAGGSGGLAVIGDERKLVLHPQGSVGDKGRAVKLPLLPGSDPALLSVGSWLLLRTGNDAKIQGTDLLGDAIETDQPRTVACLRWDALGAAEAVPVLSSPGEMEPCADQPLAVWHWQGRKLVRLQLGGDKPVLAPFAELPWDIDWTWNTLDRVQVRSRDGQRAVFDLQGKLLWSGPAGDIRMNESLAMVVLGGTAENPEATFVTLDDTPSAAVKLAIPPDWWPCEHYTRHRSRQVMLRQENRWALLDAVKGGFIRQGDAASPDDPNDRFERGWHEQGRFLVRDNRLLAKTARNRGADPARWLPIDVALSPFGLVVLDTDGGVWQANRKGEWALIGHRRGSRFGLTSGELVVANTDNRAVAAIIKDGLRTDLAANLPDAEELPPGSWRINGLTFVAPRLGELTWNEARSGIPATRLRAFDNNGMFAVVGGLVLFLQEREALRRFADPP